MIHKLFLLTIILLFIIHLNRSSSLVYARTKAPILKTVTIISSLRSSSAYYSSSTSVTDVPSQPQINFPKHKRYSEVVVHKQAVSIPTISHVSTPAPVVAINNGVSENFYPNTKLSSEITRRLSIIAFFSFLIGMVLITSDNIGFTLKKFLRKKNKVTYTNSLLLQI